MKSFHISEMFRNDLFTVVLEKTTGCPRHVTSPGVSPVMSWGEGHGIVMKGVTDEFTTRQRNT